MLFPAQEVLESVQKRLFWQYVKIQLSSIPSFQEEAKLLGAFLGQSSRQTHSVEAPKAKLCMRCWVRWSCLHLYPAGHHGFN